MAFSACRSPYTPGGSVGGAVVNGPLDSALVFLDYDFVGVLDANEPNARTNSFGKYQLYFLIPTLFSLNFKFIRIIAGDIFFLAIII